MKTLIKIILTTTLLLTLSCSKDDAPTPDPEPENQAPTAVALSAPAANAENVDVRPTFSWEATTDPDGDTLTYELYADTIENPTALIATTTNTSVALEERLSLLENYNWKVIAKDGKGGESESATQGFDTRSIVVSVATSNSDFNDRVVSTATFDDKVWVFGEQSIWNSTDGTNWTLVDDNPSYGVRTGFTVLIYEGKLWLLAGTTFGSQPINDVWSSEDGITWQLVTDTPGFNHEFSIRGAVFMNKMWFFPLEQNTDGRFERTAWVSEDGIVWSFVQNFENFIGNQLVMKNNKIYSFATDTNGTVKIVGSVSENGLEWTHFESQELVGIDFTNQSPDFMVYDNKFWTVGLNSDKILYSKDGIDWQEAGRLNKSLRNTNLVVKDDKIWVVGGTLSGGNERVNDVWFID